MKTAEIDQLIKKEFGGMDLDGSIGPGAIDNMEAGEFVHL
jgi:hypothetical protein